MSGAAVSMLELGDRTFSAIAALMHESVGLSFAPNKKSLVSSRLSSRILRLGLESFEDYFALISSNDDGGEFQVAIDLLTTNETYFFREPGHFEVLEKDLAGKPPRTLSIWSAAASFGDESYSIAMLLADMERLGRIGPAWSILGTDISDRVLRSAMNGIYPVDRIRDVSMERRKRYCLRGEGASEGFVQVNPTLRKRVRFGRLNLCEPYDGLGPFDAVFLRNVLIYFDPPTKAAVVDRALTQLKPGGLFFIGTAEGRVPCSTPLTAVAPGAFRKAAQ